MRGAAAVTLLLAAACLESPPTEAAAADAGACIQVDDRFDRDEVDGAIWNVVLQAGGTVSTGTGSLVLDADPDADFTYLDVHTVDSHPLDGLRVTADVGFEWEGNADAALVVAGPGGYIGIYSDSGLIGVAEDLEGDFALLCDGECAQYVPATHRFWRIREQDGALHFETSSEVDAFVELIPPRQVPAGKHVVLLWAEAGAGNRAVLTVHRVFTSCDR